MKLLLDMNLSPRWVDALKQVEEDLAVGALLTIDPKRSRLRLLPLA